MPSGFTHLRADAQALVRGWVAPTPALEAVRQEMLETLEQNPACMWRDGGPVHFTAGLVLLNADLSAVAMTLHAKAKRWFQFGGHFEEGDADVRAAAAREGHEESGVASFRVADRLVHLDGHDLPGAFGRCRRHLDLRFAAVTDSIELSTSDESDDVRWWPLDALPPDTEPSLRQAIEFARERLRAQFG